MSSAQAPRDLGPLRRVFAVWDRSEDDAALHAAADLADRHGAALTVFSCVEPPKDLDILARVTGMAPQDMLARLVEARRAQMGAAVAGALPGRDATRTVVQGKPFFEIIQHVLQAGADMVVKTAEPLTGVSGFLFASTDHHLMRKCPCPVWLHLPAASPTPRTVIAAVDVDEWDAAEPETLAGLNRRVIETARRLVSARGGTVHVLHAWEAMGEGLVWTFASDRDARTAAQSYVDEVETTRRRALHKLVGSFAAPPELEPRLVRGAPRAVLSDQAQSMNADIIVLGTVARTGLSGVIIGNTAEDILNNVPCSVVAVKPAGFVSPLAMSN